MDEGCVMTIFNPGSLRRVAIAIFNNQFFYEQNIAYVPLLNIDGKNLVADAQKIKVPFLDTLKTATGSNKWKMKILEDFAADSSNYAFGLAESLSINKIDFFKPVNTITYSDFIAQVQNNKLITEGELRVPILLPFVQDDPNAIFLESIWRIGVYYFVPFFLYTDMSPINLGGPLFVEEFTVDIEEKGAATCTVKFTGGIVIIPPDYIEPPTNHPRYRQAKNYDCLVTIGVNENIDTSLNDNLSIYTSYGDFAAAMSSYNLHMTQASITIKNNITKKFTANTLTDKQASDGVKYLSLQKRKVTGHLKFLASQDLMLIYTDPGGLIQELVLYFSGPFYFPMTNVYIDYFSTRVTGEGESYEHEIYFTAYLQGAEDPTIHLDYYQQSEFDLDYRGLFKPIDGNIFVTPSPF